MLSRVRLGSVATEGGVGLRRLMQRRLFRAYGIAEPNRHKLRFHLMLDELF